MRFGAAFRLSARVGLLAVGLALFPLRLSHAALLEEHIDIAGKECDGRGCNCRAGADCARMPKDVDYDACFRQSGDLAIAACSQSITSGHYRNDDLAALYNSRGIEYNAKGDFEHAIADYDQAIALEPRYSLAYNNRGLTYATERDFDRAIADYSQAIRIDPLPQSGVHINVYDNRGQAYAAKGDFDHAIADYNEAIRLDPGNVASFNNRAIAYRVKGDYDHAIADYTVAINIDPGNALLLYNRGEAYAARHDNKRAITDFSEAIRIEPLPASPTHINVYSSRGQAYLASGDLDRAMADYNEAIRIDPQYWLAYKNRADALTASGHYKSAISDYDTAIQINPNDGAVYFYRGLAELYDGSLQGALSDLNQVSALAPRDPYAALWLDIANRRSNQPSRLAEAAATLDMKEWPAPIVRLYLGQSTPEAALAAADNPDPEIRNGQLCEANFFSGELARQRGDNAEAVELFRFAAANCPKDYVQSDAAKAALKAIDRAIATTK